MATEKILIFDEAGNAKRMKVRIARFLDNEPVTASDKENIRTTLDVDDSLSGTFTTPLSVTSASDSSFTGGGKVGIGTSSPDQLIHASSSTGASLRLERDSATITSGQTYGAIEWEGQDASGGGAASGVRAKIETEATGSSGDAALKFYTAAANDVATERVRIDSSGNVGIGSTPVHDANRTTLEVKGTWGGKIRNKFGNTHGSVWYHNTSAYTYFGTETAQPLILQTNGTERWRIDGTNGNLIAASGLGIDFGSGATLDEYEEGTHTTTLTPSSSGTITLDASSNSLSYTRVGRKITVSGALGVSAVSSPVGNYINFTLPLQIADLDELSGHFAASCVVLNAAGSMGSYSIIGLDGESSFRLYKNTSNSAVATAADFSGDETIYVSVTYFTTA